MFETVVPETVAPRSRRLFYETLPLSIALHALVAGGVVAADVWEVTFPSHSPRMFAQYSLTEPPPPPPPPPPPQARPAQPVARVAPAKMPLVAPTIIPDLIPVVDNTPPPPEPAAVVADVVPGPPTGGVEGGVDGGEVGGTLGSIRLEAKPLPDLVKIERDLPLPMGSVSQEYPMYPEYARTRGWEDTLVVRYVIGKDGKVKDVTIVQPPERDEFRRATLDAIRHWRFHPFRDPANGEAKEVVHELTVEFRVKRTR